jgi:hypothetical protein
VLVPVTTSSTSSTSVLSTTTVPGPSATTTIGPAPAISLEFFGLTSGVDLTEVVATFVVDFSGNQSVAQWHLDWNFGDGAVQFGRPIAPITHRYTSTMSRAYEVIVSVSAPGTETVTALYTLSLPQPCLRWLVAGCSP